MEDTKNIEEKIRKGRLGESIDKEVKDQLNRIESKIDELMQIIKESLLEENPRRTNPRINPTNPKSESNISLEELNARLDRFM
ncbi:hypothetical protein PAT3040_00711 [Paenibacillus agaridevorans]|uniref:Uncharacterized protein n=1 Tax=Paenibacillus agaridevorans TaxID=171404 RepID=A0A2R5EMK1_9BACL|nr:hypothetical protein [Paenibacillus agaridevorans]GBG06198.1 hypothetical protein PAT3040_00711 [Paenibacillus agaridevorans]